MSDADQAGSNSSSASKSMPSDSVVVVKVSPAKEPGGGESAQTTSTTVSPEGPPGDPDPTTNPTQPRNGSLPEALLYQSSLNVILPNFIEQEQRFSGRQQYLTPPRAIQSSPLTKIRRYSQDSYALPGRYLNRSNEEVRVGRVERFTEVDQITTSLPIFDIWHVMCYW